MRWSPTVCHGTSPFLICKSVVMFNTWNSQRVQQMAMCIGSLPMLVTKVVAAFDYPSVLPAVAAPSVAETLLSGESTLFEEKIEIPQSVLSLSLYICIYIYIYLYIYVCIYIYICISSDFLFTWYHQQSNPRGFHRPEARAVQGRQAASSLDQHLRLETLCATGRFMVEAQWDPGGDGVLQMMFLWSSWPHMSHVSWWHSILVYKKISFLELRNDPEMAQMAQMARLPRLTRLVTPAGVGPASTSPPHSWQRSYNNRCKAMESHLLRNRDPSNISQPPLRIIIFLIPIFQSKQCFDLMLVQQQ